jgi:hypothetical protein
LRADVTVPPGYRVEVVAEGLTFLSAPRSTIRGRLYVVESGYVYGEIWKTPRLLRVEPNGSTTVIAEGTDNGSVERCHLLRAGNFYLAEGGEKHGGKILQISPDGRITTLVEGLPSTGDHHTNAVVIERRLALLSARAPRRTRRSWAKTTPASAGWRVIPTCTTSTVATSR